MRCARCQYNDVLLGEEVMVERGERGMMKYEDCSLEKKWAA